MKFKIILFIFFTMPLWFCSRHEEQPQLKPVEIMVFENVYSASILWKSPVSSSDTSTTYTLYVNNNEILKQYKSLSYSLNGLTETTAYRLRIEAYSGEKLTAQSEISFTTLENRPPQNFDIEELALAPTSLKLRWTAAADPANEPVVYDIYLNKNLLAEGLTTNSCILESLIPTSSYSGEIVARDTAGNTSKTTFSARTLSIGEGMFVHRFVKFQNYSRDYAFYLPSGINAQQAYPLLISLHGANGNAWTEIQRRHFSSVAERENFILLQPQALLGTFNGETIFQWNAHYIFPWDDVAYLNYLIDVFDTEYNVDLSRVYISGMSNGGFMTFFAIRPLQNRIAAIAPMAGIMSSNIYTGYTLNRPIPLCYIHGTADSIVRMNGNPSLEMILGLWIANNKCNAQATVTQLPDLVTTDNSTVTLYEYKGYGPDSEIQFYQINGGGHSVPGTETGANMDINACEVIWSFFSRHSYPGHSVR